MKTPEPEVDQLAAFLSAFNREGDRGAALVAASMLDERLEQILAGFLADTPTSTELLHGFNAPLGTFASRTAAALSLGLIEANEFEEITLVRKIRNKFGHGWKPLSFESPEISILCAKLPWLGPAEHEAGSSQRSRFNAAVAILLTDLLWRVRLVEHEKRTARGWPNKARG